jgi:hypothetical protein
MVANYFPLQTPRRLAAAKTAPKERRKLASYEVAGTIGKIILSCRRRAVAALWRAAKAEGTTENKFVRRPFRTLIFYP